MFRMVRFAAIPALFAVLVLFGCARTKETPRAPVGANTRAEIDSLFESYVDALNASDSTTVRAMFGPGNEVTIAGRERFLRGDQGIGNTTEGLLSVGQNKFDIDSLEVIPVEQNHALALVIYTVEPSDQDVPAFHTTGTYLLERSSTTAKWAIIHAHVCAAREL